MDGSGRAPAESFEGNAIRVVSLNLGGRNTNPVEFELRGDSSEAAVEAMAILRRANKALSSAKAGPLQMPAPEMKAVEEILALISGDFPGEAPSKWHSSVVDLFRCKTWEQVLSCVRATCPHAFNALNLRTLPLGRPSVWENPASCRDFTHTMEYLTAWKKWYIGLDRASQFWLEDAPCVANKRGMEVPLCFAGLLLFDVMCLNCAHGATSGTREDGIDDFSEDTRALPFRELVDFAAKLPASCFGARHARAREFAAGAHAVLAQEARSFADHPTTAAEFLPPFRAFDGFTAVFLRKNSFSEATDISLAVMKRMEELVDGGASAEARRAWRTTASRLAAVSCQCSPDLGNFRACFASLHASKSDLSLTASFVESLRAVLDDYDAELCVLGMDSNVAGKDTSTFQKRLWKAGFEIGCSPKQQQVTVAKQRTAFQTQVQKVGDLDIAHKDYIVSWTSPRVRRGPTSYTPDLRSCYGVEQETKQCVRLPTARWPFDHCGVATAFRQTSRCGDGPSCNRRSLLQCLVAALVALIFASPLASTARSSPYGKPGAWYHNAYIFTRRTGICETAAPCPEGWLQQGGSCYVTTPKLPYPDLRQYCEDFHGSPITIESEAENELVLQSLCPKGDFCYIGLQGTFSGTQYWVSGEEYNYTRLVEIAKSPLPLLESSRMTDYVGTVVANLPGEVDGCDLKLALAFERFDANPSMVSMVRVVAIPALAIIVSGLLLVLPRPGEQRFVTGLLFLSLITNIIWLAQPLLNACFVADYLALLSVSTFGLMIDSGGHTAVSLLSLWMIIERMTMLYPGRVLKRLFYAIICIQVAMTSIFVLFVDLGAPVPLTWAIGAYLGGHLVLSAIYVVASAKCSVDLYRTWACLHREATNGCNDGGTALMRSVREARLHLFAVTFAIITGAVRWAVILIVLYSITQPELPEWIANAYMLASLLDCVTNDVCAHFLACMDIDAAMIRAKGVTTEVAERAEREVRQHQLAVQLLKAAPTSAAQLRDFAELERRAKAAIGSDQEKAAFLTYKSAIHVETVRVHKLMHCVRARAMTMALRYQYLIDVPGLDNGAPRQVVPEAFAGEKSEAAASKYFDWLHGQASGAEHVLFHQLNHLLAKFNHTDWPSDLGLAPEEFPWRIWASSRQRRGTGGAKRLLKGEGISPGDTLIHRPAGGGAAAAGCLPSPGRRGAQLCVVQEETSPESVSIHRSGMLSPQEVPRDELRTCHGGGVFIPGPLKKAHRCMDKVKADYEGSAPWPAAASLVDVCRCMLLCDDPYAVAVLVAYLRKNMTVVRLKNRFSEDVVEPHLAGELQAMFSAAASHNSSSGSNGRGGSETGSQTAITECGGDKQYRDISMNVAVKTPSGHPFVCEIQVTLSNLAILKHADTKLYTIRRMKSAEELCKVHVYSSDGKEVSSQVEV